MKKFILLFGKDVEVNVNCNFFMEFNLGGVVAHFLDGVFVEDDVLAVHFDASGFLDGVSRKSYPWQQPWRGFAASGLPKPWLSRWLRP